MEITESMIYWITRLDTIRWIPVLIALPILIQGLCIWFSGKEPQTNLLRAMRYWFVFMLFSLPVTFIPTTKQMCAIKVIPIIANNEEVQELPNKVVELANDWIDELKPEKTN